jgi:hypothetical protein
VANHPQQHSSQAKESTPKRQTVKLPSQGLVALAPQVDSIALQRAIADPGAASPSVILALQAAYGNRAANGVLDGASRPAVRAKLVVGPAGDRHEQEADRVAPKLAGAMQRQEEEDEPLNLMPLQQQEEEELQMTPAEGDRRSAGGSFEAGAAVESRLTAHQGGGSPLPDEVRAYMEPRFGTDFSGVRVHTGGEAAQMSRKLSAQAFTHGQDIYMGEGRYDPGTGTGKRLLAHELTHVIQQAGSRTLSRAVQRVPLTDPQAQLGIHPALYGSLWLRTRNRIASEFDRAPNTAIASAKEAIRKKLGISASLWGELAGSHAAILGAASVAAAKQEAAKGIGIAQATLWGALSRKKILKSASVDDAQKVVAKDLGINGTLWAGLTGSHAAILGAASVAAAKQEVAKGIGITQATLWGVLSQNKILKSASVSDARKVVAKDLGIKVTLWAGLASSHAAILGAASVAAAKQEAAKCIGITQATLWGVLSQSKILKSASVSDAQKVVAKDLGINVTLWSGLASRHAAILGAASVAAAKQEVAKGLGINVTLWNTLSNRSAILGKDSRDAAREEAAAGGLGINATLWKTQSSSGGIKELQDTILRQGSKENAWRAIGTDVTHGLGINAGLWNMLNKAAILQQENKTKARQAAGSGGLGIHADLWDAFVDQNKAAILKKADRAAARKEAATGTAGLTVTSGANGLQIEADLWEELGNQDAILQQNSKEHAWQEVATNGLGINAALWRTAAAGGGLKEHQAAILGQDSKEQAWQEASTNGLGIDAGLWRELINQGAILGQASKAGAQKEAASGGLDINAGLWAALDGRGAILKQINVEEAKKKARQVLCDTLTSTSSPPTPAVTVKQYESIGRTKQDEILKTATGKNDAASKVVGPSGAAVASLAETGGAGVNAITHLRKSDPPTPTPGATTAITLVDQWVGPRLKAGAQLTLYNKFAQHAGEEWQLAKYSWARKQLQSNLTYRRWTEDVWGFVRSSKVMGAEELGIHRSLWTALGTASTGAISQEKRGVAAGKEKAAVQLGISVGLWRVLGNQEAILQQASKEAARKEAATGVGGLGIKDTLWDALAPAASRDKILLKDGKDAAWEEARQVLCNTLTSTPPANPPVTVQQFQNIGRAKQDEILKTATGKNDAASAVTTGAREVLAQVPSAMAMVIATAHLRKCAPLAPVPGTTTTITLEDQKVGPKLTAGARLTLYNKFAQHAGEEWQLAKYSWARKQLQSNLTYRRWTENVWGFVRSSKVLHVSAAPGLTREQKTDLIRYRAPSRGEGWKQGLGTTGSVFEWLAEQADAIGGTGGGFGELFGAPSAQYKNWWVATYGPTFKSDYLSNNPGASDEDISKAMGDRIADHWSDWSISKPFDLVSKISDVAGSSADLFSGGFGTLFGLLGMAGGIVGAIKAGDTWEKWEQANTALEGGVGTLFGIGKVVTGTGGVVTKSAVLSGGGEAWETAKNVFGFIGDGLGTVKSALETMWGVVKIVYASIKQASKGGNTENILAESAGTIKALFETGGGAVKTTKGVLDTFSSVSGVAGAIFGAVTAAINIVTTLVSLVVEGYGFVKQAYKLVTGYIRKKRLAQVPGSALVKHLGTITWKRIKRAWGEVTLKGANIIADLFSGIASIVSLGASIAGAVSSPTGIGPAVGAIVSTAANLAGGILKGVIKGGGSFFAGWHRLNLWLRQQGREKAARSAPGSHWRRVYNANKSRQAKHEQRVKSAIKIMKRVENLPACNQTTKSTYDEVKLLLEATGVDLPALFKENGKPQEQIKMLIGAMKARE